MQLTISLLKIYFSNIVIYFELLSNINTGTKWIKKLDILIYKAFTVGYVLYIKQHVHCGYFQWVCVKYLLCIAHLWRCISLNICQ